MCSPSALQIGWDKAHVELKRQVCAEVVAASPNSGIGGEVKLWGKKRKSTLVGRRDLFIIRVRPPPLLDPFLSI